VLRSTFVPLNEKTLQYTVQYPEFRRKAITAKPLDAVRAASMIRMRASSVLTASTTHYAMARTHYTICFVSLECVQGTNSIQCELHLTCIAHLQKYTKHMPNAMQDVSGASGSDLVYHFLRADWPSASVTPQADQG
jgi:hypothetical protein